MSLPFINDTLGDLLNNYVHYITKQMQEIADTLWGSENDNEDELITLPASIQTRGIFCICGYAVSDFSDYAPYTPSDFAHGNFYEVTSVDINYINGNLNISGLNSLGRLGAYSWGNVSASCRDLAESIITEYISEHANDYIFTKIDYPTDPVTYEYSGPNDTIFFLQNNEQHVFETTFPKYDGTDYTSDFCNIKFIDLLEMSGEYYVEKTLYIISENVAGRYVSQYGDGLFITNTNDQTFINNYINDNGATHNYTYTYETENGDTVTIYYGDNYVITKSDPDAETTYNEYKNALDVVIDKINEDGGFNITVPTYRENKYGPPDDPDDDIEVDMPLNDAAFGTGLSHYYVTTVDAPVLNDISEAMSSWNINNTGKDLYRNLLSCRITKVGPIPAENSTFVIYGEELQHNGSPISINKITGNPSMDLGEYEILPKFSDFRDYAPYTKIEMFIPYCGWVALPSHVMSSEDKPKIITGTLLCDIIAGTCKAVIKCNDTVVAEASGFTAVDVPFTGENVGMKMAGIASAITSYGNTASKTVGNIASGGMSGGAGAGAAAAGGLVGLLGSYAQMYSAFNANYTEICGKTGDGCNVAGLNKVYIKIQRPKTGGYEAPDFVPEDYGHTTGFIAMKKSLISDCEGLIVCSNPDTSGIGGATDRERQMIKNLLESGIIVRQTEPEP